MNKKISIKDIASQLGISITTVSFVINGKAKEKHISEKTTQKILEFTAKLGYEPNSLAQSLRTGKTKIIGFLVDDISEPFFSGIARFIDEKASEKGYKIIFSSTRNSTKKAIELLRIFKGRQVDAYIIALPEGLEQEIETLIQTQTPVVLFDRYVPTIDTNYVVINNRLSTYTATEHLIANGYRNIGFVTIDTQQQQMIDRLGGYEDAINAHQLPLAIQKINYTNSKESIQEIISFLKQNKQLDSIIFAANYICMDGLRAFKEMNISVLKDLAVVSFDDFELLEFYSPPITAIVQPLEEIAENIMNILLKKLNSTNTDFKNKQVILSTKLNIRGSSAPKH